MGKRKKAPQERKLTKIEGISLEEIQLAEQLYNSAGLDPVVDAGLKDYDERLQKEDKLISKVLGPRGSDIKGYGETVAGISGVIWITYNSGLCQGKLRY